MERKPYQQIDQVQVAAPKQLKEVIDELYEKEKKFVYAKQSIQRDELI